MNKMHDALEKCLQAMERGADLESVLAFYPDLAEALRPLLVASIGARKMSVQAPSPEAMRRGRANLLQRAAEMRAAARRPARQRVIPAFQRLSIAFALTALFLLSGTGLVRASSSALPGENLYPVKRTWEGMRLLLIFNNEQREALEGEFESERLNEVSELLTDGRDEAIQFAGIYLEQNGVTYVSGIKVMIVSTTQLPAEALQNGAAVIITGHTNADGFVEADSIELLPPGSVVPGGSAIEVESENETEGEVAPNSNQDGGSGSGQERKGSGSQPGGQSFEMEGTVESMQPDRLVVDGQTAYLEGAEIRGILTVGARVKVEGYFGEDGRFIISKVEVKESKSGQEGGDKPSGSDSNDNGGGDNANDDHRGGDKKGPGGGGGEGGDD